MPKKLVITPRTLHAWAVAKDPWEKVGRKFSLDSCPIAQFIWEHGGRRIRVDDDLLLFQGNSEIQGVDSQPSPALKKVIKAIDESPLYEITAENFLSILEKIAKKAKS